MGTNRYHFSLIPQEHQIKNVDTKYQYFIKHEDIVKHVNFKQLRAKHGSIFAFHGSPQENWHSILRSGLQIGKGGYLVRIKYRYYYHLIVSVKWCSIWCRDLCFT
jgi:hypothetical protein